MMARRTGRRDHGGAGFPSWWPTARVGDGPGAGGAAEFTARAPREGNRPGFRKGLNELSGKVLKTRVIY
jgi:hypothetical protein